MTEHKATPEQWAADRYDWAHANTEALDGNSAFRCIMELRDRVEALEAAAKPVESSDLLMNQVAGEPMTESRLVLLLAWKIAEILSKSRPGDDCTPFAQDVIHEVAAWLRKRNVRIRASVEIAGDLEREAGR